jgi:His/Glu/Gln/Arg/opine family amino acid ABC transporter permease subunit
MQESYLSLTANDGVFFLKATLTTLWLTLSAIACGTIIGFLMGILRCSRNKIASSAPLVIMEPLRNSPLVTQLFLLYYGLPMISSVVLDAYTSAFIALALNTSAFMAVLVHSSIKAVPRSQWEAAYALGLGKISAFTYVIGRQALRILIPPAITLYIGQLQVSSVVSLISLIDLTKAGEVLTLRTMKPFLVWAIVFGIYFVISYPLSKLSRYLEKRIDFAL